MNREIEKLRLDPYDNDGVSLAYAINAKLDEIIDALNAQLRPSCRALLGPNVEAPC